MNEAEFTNAVWLCSPYWVEICRNQLIQLVLEWVGRFHGRAKIDEPLNEVVELHRRQMSWFDTMALEVNCHAFQIIIYRNSYFTHFRLPWINSNA